MPSYARTTVSRRNRKSKGPSFLCFTYMCTYKNTGNDKVVKGLVVTKSNSDFSCIFLDKE